jgi:hypothetical protein
VAYWVKASISGSTLRRVSRVRCRRSRRLLLRERQTACGPAEGTHSRVPRSHGGSVAARLRLRSGGSLGRHCRPFVPCDAPTIEEATWTSRPWGSARRARPCVPVTRYEGIAGAVVRYRHFDVSRAHTPEMPRCTPRPGLSAMLCSMAPDRGQNVGASGRRDGVLTTVEVSNQTFRRATVGIIIVLMPGLMIGGLGLIGLTSANTAPRTIGASSTRAGTASSCSARARPISRTRNGLLPV